MDNSVENVSDNDIQSLSRIFQEGLNCYNTIINSAQPTNSPDVQINIKRTMKTFERATRLVSLASVFSNNEGIDEVATNDLQYFLLPALLGSLALKLTTGERKDIVDVAEIYFKDFLNRCNEYGLHDHHFRENKDTKNKKVDGKTEFEMLEMAVSTRANKIQRFKEQKELKSKLENLKNSMGNDHVDEDIKRNYFLTMIKLFIYEAIDELNSIEMEKPILEHMASMKKDEKPQQKRQQPPPLKPFIITRDDVQKAVYGAGYPSLPTMTVKEFYDKRVEDGVFPDPNKKKSEESMSLQEAALAGVSLNRDEEESADTENLQEGDDEYYLARMRAKDEFKDDHRRGWGNRMNRS